MAFEDNKPDDVAELTRQPVTYISVAEEEEENECVLIGHLREESNVAVAVSGCPGSDSFEVHLILHINCSINVNAQASTGRI